MTAPDDPITRPRPIPHFSCQSLLQNCRFAADKTDGPTWAPWYAMIDRLFSPHLANLQNSLGRTSQRQELLTKNLANINVPGYKRQDVDFGIALQQELGRGSDGLAREDRGSVRTDGNSVDLEKEVFAMAETELRYQLLTDMTSKYFSGLKNVIKEGR